MKEVQLPEIKISHEKIDITMRNTNELKAGSPSVQVKVYLKDSKEGEVITLSHAEMILLKEFVLRNIK